MSKANSISGYWIFLSSRHSGLFQSAWTAQTEKKTSSLWRTISDCWIIGMLRSLSRSLMSFSKFWKISGLSCWGAISRKTIALASIQKYFIRSFRIWAVTNRIFKPPELDNFAWSSLLLDIRWLSTTNPCITLWSNPCGRLSVFPWVLSLITKAPTCKSYYVKAKTRESQELNSDLST